MYAFIRGIVREMSANFVVLETGGIGYLIYVPLHSKIPLLGESCLLHTSLIIREQEHSLYGFIEREEKELFELLIEVSGIGPKTALNVLSHMPVENFQKAIQDENHLLLSKIPGIGKKTAERLILEFKESKKPILQPKQAVISASNNLHKDALQALINLGIAPMAADKALREAFEEIGTPEDLSSLLSVALRKNR